MDIWTKMEEEYAASRVSYRALAAKYGVSVGQVSKQGKLRRWPLLRREGSADDPKIQAMPEDMPSGPAVGGGDTASVSFADTFPSRGRLGGRAMLAPTLPDQHCRGGNLPPEQERSGGRLIAAPTWGAGESGGRLIAAPTGSDTSSGPSGHLLLQEKALEGAFEGLLDTMLLRLGEYLREDKPVDPQKYKHITAVLKDIRDLRPAKQAQEVTVVLGGAEELSV